MDPPLPIPELRRMRLDEMLRKLEQIERQAQLTAVEYPQGLPIERQRLIIAIARQLRTHLKDQLRHGTRHPTDPPGRAL
jgi:hypothetical protein